MVLVLGATSYLGNLGGGCRGPRQLIRHCLGGGAASPGLPVNLHPNKASPTARSDRLARALILDSGNANQTIRTCDASASLLSVVHVGGRPPGKDVHA